MNGKLTYADLPGIYAGLSADLPPEGIERVPSSVSRKGYDTTGYGYQFHVNRMNEVLFGHWRALHKVFSEEVGKTSSGKPMYYIIMHMTIQIGNWIYTDEGSKFEVLMEVDCFGGHDSLDRSSAYKGAYTNAFKKTSALLGVGRKAFEGTVDEDFYSAEAQENQKPQQKPSQSSKPQQNKQAQQAQQPQQAKPEKPAQPQQQVQGLATEGQRKKIYAVAKNGLKMSDEQLKKFVVERTGKQSSKELTSKEASDLIKELEKMGKAKHDAEDVYNSFESRGAV